MRHTLIVLAPFSAGHHLVCAGLDLGALVLAEETHLADAAVHLRCLLLLLQLLLLVLATLRVRVLLVLALGPRRRVRLSCCLPTALPYRCLGTSWI